MTSWSGGSSFSDLPSWQSSFNTNLPSSLSKGTQAGGGFGNMLGPALGLASAGIGLISGIGQQRTAANIAQAQINFAERARQDAFEQNKLAGALKIFDQTFGAGTASDLSFNREKAAKQFGVGPYAERLMGLGSEESKRERMAAISPESKERAQFENRLAIQRSLAEKRAQTDAMFGPTSSSYRA